MNALKNSDNSSEMEVLFNKDVWNQSTGTQGPLSQQTEAPADPGVPKGCPGILRISPAPDVMRLVTLGHNRRIFPVWKIQTHQQTPGTALVPVPVPSEGSMAEEEWEGAQAAESRGRAQRGLLEPPHSILGLRFWCCWATGVPGGHRLVREQRQLWLPVPMWARCHGHGAVPSPGIWNHPQAGANRASTKPQNPRGKDKPLSQYLTGAGPVLPVQRPQGLHPLLFSHWGCQEWALPQPEDLGQQESEGAASLAWEGRWGPSELLLWGCWGVQGPDRRNLTVPAVGTHSWEVSLSSWAWLAAPACA